MKTITHRFLIALLAACPANAWAACPDEGQVARYVAEFESAKPSKGFGKDITETEAACARAKLTEALIPVLGRPVGYKALFTNLDSQKRFGVSGPSWGVMYGRWMFNDDVKLPAKFGAIQRYETDFLVEVKDAGLADAKTAQEALSHISALIPFIELPDLMLEGKIAGPELIATNAAFRGGVIGQPIPVVKADPALLKALAEMDVIVTNETTGAEIGREKGSVLMDQPINAALWLAKELKKNGISLKKGDLLSLGGFLASKPVVPGARVSVRYKGLPGDPAVYVSFE